MCMSLQQKKWRYMRWPRSHLKRSVAASWCILERNPATNKGRTSKSTSRPSRATTWAPVAGISPFELPVANSAPTRPSPTRKCVPAAARGDRLVWVVGGILWRKEDRARWRTIARKSWPPLKETDTASLLTHPSSFLRGGCPRFMSLTVKFFSSNVYNFHDSHV